MLVLCNGIVVEEDDRRRSGLPCSPLDMKYYNSSIEH